MVGDLEEVAVRDGTELVYEATGKKRPSICPFSYSSQTELRRRDKEQNNVD